MDGLGGTPAGFNAGEDFHEKFNMVADPVANNIVYISGQGRANIFRYNPAGAGNWVQIVSNRSPPPENVANTACHPDARDLEFLDNTTLLETDDGGIYFLTNPTDATANSWQSLNGNFGAFEVYSVAYDSTNHAIIAGFQDNGSAGQTTAGGLTWRTVPGGELVLSAGGDGQFQQVDDTSIGADVFRYSLENTFASFFRNRYDNSNNVLNIDAGVITGATNASPLVITSPGHPLQNGDGVFIVGVNGNTAANGSFLVANRTADTFALTTFAGVAVPGNGVYAGGGIWQRIGIIGGVSGAAGTPVVITSNNHRLNTGDQVHVQQMTGNTGLNSSRFYVTVLSPNQFTLDGTSGDGSNTNTGYWLRCNRVLLKSAMGASDMSGLNPADGGVRPLTGAANANPLVITAAGHGLQNGETVIIANVRGNTAANGTFLVASVTANTFELRTAAGGPVVGNGAYTGGGTWRRSLGFFYMPYVLNAVDPRRMLLGFSGLYEDADVSAANGFAGDVITDITATLVAGFAGIVSTLAYGGRQGGVDHAEVAFVGTMGGKLFFREAAGVNFTDVTNNGAGHLPKGAVIRDVVLDPQDWRRVYVIRDNEVWMTSDVTSLAANPFSNITGNLAGDPGDLTTVLRSIALYDSTPAVAGDSIIVAGGLGGVYRRLPSATPGQFVWTEYGTGMPNAVVTDLRFLNVDPDGNAANGTGLLIAGTFGSGVRTLANVSATITRASVLTVSGSENEDTAGFVRDADNPTLIDIFINNPPAYTTPVLKLQLSVLQKIQFDGASANDTLTVDIGNGAISPPDGIFFNGGDGTDLVTAEGRGVRVSESATLIQFVARGVGVEGSERVGLENVETIQNDVPEPTTDMEAILAAVGGGLLFGGGTLAALLASGTTDPAVIGFSTAGAGPSGRRGNLLPGGRSERCPGSARPAEGQYRWVSRRDKAPAPGQRQLPGAYPGERIERVPSGGHRHANQHAGRSGERLGRAAGQHRCPHRKPWRNHL